MLHLDGAQGEGGGQVLRTALALSLATGRPFRIERVRARREKPGLLRQHLASVRAAAQVGGARVDGATLGSQELTFEPGGPVRGGTYVFDVGSAGSTTLVLQTVLVPLALVADASDVTILGGTHNPAAPPFEFLERSFSPLAERMGVRLRAVLDRIGFFPAGGGRIRVRIGGPPAPAAAPSAGPSHAPPGTLQLLDRGDVVSRRARILLAQIPLHVADREHQVLVRRARMRPQDVAVVANPDADGAGNVIALEIACRHVTAVFTGFGRRGLPAEEVAKAVADAASTWEDAGVPVEEHLADQLLLPMALTGGGAFRTVEPSPHTTTNAAVIEAFLGPRVRVAKEADGRAWRVEVDGLGAR